MILVRIKTLVFTSTLIFGTIAKGQIAESSTPPGQLVDLGGYNLHFSIKGSNGPTIIIEGGTGSWSLQWMDLQDELSKYYKVVAYDRAGYGWSDPSPYSRTANNIAEELHSGLLKAGLSAPFILLGHSYGGFIVKTFVKKYPDDVSAIILADIASENQFEQLPPMVKMILESAKKRFKQNGAMARAGKLLPAHIPIDSTLNSDYWRSYQYSASRSSFYEAMYNEMDLLALTYSHSQIKNPIDKPVLVITAENSFGAFSAIPNMPIEESNAIWAKLQKNQLEISSNSRQYIIKNATHDLLLTAPEEFAKVIIEFIKELN